MRSVIAASTAFLLAAVSSPALAQPTGTSPPEQIEDLASEEEAAKVRETLRRINCEAARIEKESENLFEVDDADCQIGQYDIKLDGEYNIIVMSRDSLLR